MQFCSAELPSLSLAIQQVITTHCRGCAATHSRLRVRVSATDTDVSSIESELEAAKAELAAAKKEHRLLERKKEEAYRYFICITYSDIYCKGICNSRQTSAIIAYREGLIGLSIEVHALTYMYLHKHVQAVQYCLA
jgi:hypothetical protein